VVSPGSMISTSHAASPVVLVMCTGNVCRSPMAEALLRYYAEQKALEVEIFSRGLAAPVGRSPHPYAIEVSKANGVPIDPDKRAVAVSTVEMSIATVVLVMDSEHRRLVQQRFPTALGKTFLLGQWQNREIVDPINEPMTTFELVWKQCRDGALSWVDRLYETGLLKRRAMAS